MNTVTRGMQYKEAISRMRKLKLMSNVLRDFEENVINKSERMGPIPGILYWVDEEEKQFIEKWEEKSGNLVYHILKDNTSMGIMRSIMYVSKYNDEWKMDKEDLEQERAVAYCIIGFDETYGEYGSIGVSPANGGLQRKY